MQIHSYQQKSQKYYIIIYVGPMKGQMRKQARVQLRQYKVLFDKFLRFADRASQYIYLSI